MFAAFTLSDSVFQRVGAATGNDLDPIFVLNRGGGERRRTFYDRSNLFARMRSECKYSGCIDEGAW